MSRDTGSSASTARVALVRSARVVVQHAPDSSVAVLCTGPARAFLEIQQCLGEFETEVHKVAVIVDPTASATVRRVRGLTVVTLADLGDLTDVVTGLVPA